MTLQSPVLAVRLPNWVGDVVMALPTILQLRQTGFNLRLVGRNWANDLLAGCNLPIAPVGKGMLTSAQVLKLQRADGGLLFTNSLSSALAMRMAHIPAVGYRADCRGWMLHLALSKVPGHHEVEYFWRLGEAASSCWGQLHDWPAMPPKRIQLPLTSSHRALAAKALGVAGINGPYVVCCPMAAGKSNGQSKQWPHFAGFCSELSALGYSVVICPGPNELEQSGEFQQTARILPGISLGAYAAIMENSLAVVANDSGPMHMATAVGAPVLGIFGHANTTRTAPWGGMFIGGSDGWPTSMEVLAGLEEMLGFQQASQLSPIAA